MRRDDPEVAVVGGGICGLTTAIALERRGIEPRVYEAASEYRPVGAGILLQTNAMLVLDRLGVADRVRSAGVPLDGGGIRAPDGDDLQRFDLESAREEFGYGFVAVHRADLQRILLSELDADVETGRDCVAVPSADPPAVRFGDGTTVEADVVVGADGIHSTVRSAVAPRAETRSLPGVVYRGVVDVDLPAPHSRRGVEVWGEGTYTGGAPLGDGRFYWFGTAPEPLGDRDDPDPAALRAHVAGYPEPIPTVLASLSAEDLVVTDLEDVAPLDRWHRDGLVLAGDAAHAMLPFAGQGAAQAIEDALTLADAVARHGDRAVAFAAYEDERKPRAERILAESHRLGRLGTMQSGLGCRVRNVAVGAVPDSLVERLRRRTAAGTSLPDTAPTP